MKDLYLACFFAGAFLGMLGTFVLLVWATTRIKKKQLSEYAEKQKAPKKETE